MRAHAYDVTTVWTGNTGSGTSGYRDYSRSLEVSAAGRATLPGSSDPVFRGDPARYNPEEMLVASLSSCHMLWYLHLCSVNGIVVAAYRDEASGTMVEDGAGGGRFTEAVLRPRVTVAEAAMVDRATALHAEANARCFIAASVGFPVRHEPALSDIILLGTEEQVRLAAAHKTDETAVRAPERQAQVIAGVRSRAQAAGLDVDVAEQVWRAMIAAFVDLELGVQRRAISS